ncbi:hypothetical protein BU14_0134s0019 [Porphyra umbilicalis]|uniref:Uncharacterized protein n=1 Tax=Porphyra umbilicalis TaxID=2786 RepID=A0A1X6PAB2_PORUM|nr:hypothetical protein BU14_0134s0019 [Porphyra umbilicalis]|eukprot:OSX77798.1 hypothetical protein BU14_0134s0019 [Porphyra umbilicalis]
MAPSATWTVADLEPLVGKTFLVTGGNLGVGFECALHLARRGASVVIGCRSAARGGEAVTRIQAALGGADVTPGGFVSVTTVDMSDLSSVKAAANSLCGRAHTELHGLILNAGVMMLPRSLTVDGQEVQMATNHLGHFALTGLLLPPFAAAAPAARVVCVSSPAHRRCTDLALDGWTLATGDTPMGAYARSKAADLRFVRALARRLAAAGSPVVAVAAQPGWALTALVDKASPDAWTALFLTVLKPCLSHSAEGGACPLLYAATEADVVADQYWGPSFLQSKGPPAAASSRAGLVLSDEAAAALWAKSEEVTGVSYLG